MSSAAAAIDILQSMTLDERIAEVAKDVLSRTDRYKGIPADGLAELLGVAIDPFEAFEDWKFVQYVPFMSAESLLEDYGADEMLELLYKALSPERVEQLKKATEGLDPKSALSLFSVDEQRAMERVHQEYEAGSEIIVEVAYCEVRSTHDKLLMFEASLYDGEVVGDLRTPYDRRDGKFIDLTRCLICWGEPLDPLTG